MRFLSISPLLIIVIIHIDDSISLIVSNGKRVTGNEFNWVVLVYSTDTQTSVCTGSIISELHILTAAHCVKNVTEKDVNIIAGTNWLYHTPNFSFCNLRKISKHPSFGKDYVNLQGSNYDEDQYESSDIAVLTLEAPLTFGEYIGKISLPDHELDLSKHPLCNVAGWGTGSTSTANPHLLWTTLRMGSEAEYSTPYCRAHYGIMCGLSPDRNTYLAGGDSGAALQCNGVLAAVHVAGGKAVELPMLFQSVFHHLPFIHKIMKEDLGMDVNRGMDNDQGMNKVQGMDVDQATTVTISKPSQWMTERCICRT